MAQMTVMRQEGMMCPAREELASARWQRMEVVRNARK